ncbi:MAG: hypothetical protein ACRDBG_04315, partial [Waterburya sp.]
ALILQFISQHSGRINCFDLISPSALIYFWGLNSLPKVSRKYHTLDKDCQFVNVLFIKVKY